MTYSGLLHPESLPLQQAPADPYLHRRHPCGSVVKNPPANVGDMGLIPGSRKSPGEGNGNPPQYSCLGNTMDREAWKLQSMGLQRHSD